MTRIDATVLPNLCSQVKNLVSVGAGKERLGAVDLVIGEHIWIVIKNNHQIGYGGWINPNVPRKFGQKNQVLHISENFLTKKLVEALVTLVVEHTSIATYQKSRWGDFVELKELEKKIATWQPRWEKTRRELLAELDLRNPRSLINISMIANANDHNLTKSFYVCR